MTTRWVWPLVRFVRDVAALMAAGLVVAAALGLIQGDWPAAAIQNTLYAGSVLFMTGMVILALHFLRANAAVRAGVPVVQTRWAIWGPRILIAGFLTFIIGMWLQGVVLGEWFALPAPPG